MGQRHVAGTIRCLNVLQSGAVTALALHVVVRGILDHVPASRCGEAIAALGHRVAAITAGLRVAGACQGLEGAGVGRRLPVLSVLDMAIAAGGLVRGDVKQAEESVDTVRRRIERRAVAKDNLVGTAPGQEGEGGEQGSQDTGTGRSRERHSQPQAVNFAIRCT